MEYELEISEESAEKLHKLFDSKFEELKEAHNRFKEGIETTEDLLEHYKHYRMDVETKKGSTKLNLIELKYYEKLVNIVKKQDKMINEMVDCIWNYDICDYEITDYAYRKCEYIADDKEKPCKECIKQYFEKKVEGE